MKDRKYRGIFRIGKTEKTQINTMWNPGLDTGTEAKKRALRKTNSPIKKMRRGPK